MLAMISRTCISSSLAFSFCFLLLFLSLPSHSGKVPDLQHLFFSAAYSLASRRWPRSSLSDEDYEGFLGFAQALLDNF
ncbi:hypothetical protein ACFX13_013512 [Malus domestica]